MKTEQHEATDHEAPEDISDVLRYLAPHWQTIAGAVLLAFLGIVGFGLFASNREKAREAGWAEYLGATANRDPVALQAIADGNIGRVSAFARQSAAQAKLIEATSAVFTNRDAAKAGFEEAVAAFGQAIKQAGDNELIHKRSIWGLGQAYEGLNDLGKAKETYQQLVDKWPDSSLAKQAQERIASLNDPATQEFYTWFFAQTPPPASLPASGQIPGLPFETPKDTFSIPDPTDSSDIDDGLPSTGDLNFDFDILTEATESNAEGTSEASSTTTSESAAETTGEADTDEADTDEADTGEADTGEADTGEADTGEADTGEAETDEEAATEAVAGEEKTDGE